jgi:hypothetical protein
VNQSIQGIPVGAFFIVRGAGQWQGMGQPEIVQYTANHGFIFSRICTKKQPRISQGGQVLNDLSSPAMEGIVYLPNGA